jgi:ABC-type polysaccharide/polyol phosphate transport system ATPase subunit
MLGVIGSNGAGKSTLLKLMARVLQPTGGRVWVKGRVAPLLDISGGFHPELTGRENVFLNGALLGLSRGDIRRRFDSIVDFAELAEFIDAPLRMYSSGMVARLGFAIATDVEPDILLVDEVLAVGDEKFRAKCADRMRRFRDSGATILLVSHDMHTVRQLCDRALWLEKGRVNRAGPAEEVVEQYSRS